jgi:hypothetical protein
MFLLYLYRKKKNNVLKIKPFWYEKEIYKKLNNINKTNIEEPI